MKDHTEIHDKKADATWQSLTTSELATRDVGTRVALRPRLDRRG